MEKKALLGKLCLKSQQNPTLNVHNVYSRTVQVKVMFALAYGFPFRVIGLDRASGYIISVVDTFYPQ